MHRYETLGVLGEGAYGIVMKCRHKETKQLVAVKKFMEPEEDPSVKKIALREVKMLKLLRHENLIALLEVFKKKKHYYLVFEYVDHTVLDELEESPNGLAEYNGKGIIWQVIQGIRFCHLNGVVHRDVKPENVLISEGGVVKLCDFGFARRMAAPGEAYTDYVATRWYRAPELLVGDNMYNESVDVWSIGCVLVELLTGEPLFPGDSDIDQIYHITKCLGNLITYHRELFNTNALFRGLKMPTIRRVSSIERRFPKLSLTAVEFIKTCLNLDPRHRAGSDYILNHNYFNLDNFKEKFIPHLASQSRLEYKTNFLLQRLGITVYGSGFRQFPPSPIPEVVTPQVSTSPPRTDNIRSVTKRKSYRGNTHHPIDVPQSEDINPIEQVLRELQKQSFMNQDLGMDHSLSQELSQRISKELTRCDSPLQIPNKTKHSHGYFEKEFRNNITCSPIRRLTPELDDIRNSPKRVTGVKKNSKSSFEHCIELPIPPQQVNLSKRKQSNTNTINGNKSGASFLPNLIPKEKQHSKTYIRALPNPETVLATRKWSERLQASLTKLSDPAKLQPGIPQLTAIDVSYIPHNDSDESFIV
ncbi:Cyclin-dependent kinase-like 2 [Oopsacas minuta]|uniref:cyclin-dependent kinase n=1 Tax=Oopsacas minuta TaxID=111878 RepID=A0AAV7JAW9_9METZ|nr:Cyclin-dependent kinase-like 2 [Oopsacas minuta]